MFAFVVPFALTANRKFASATLGTIGFAEVSLREDHVDGASISPVPYLEAWFVEASFRKQGVGQALIGAVERCATSRGYTELASDAEIENSLSIRLHKQLGFAEIDRNVTFLKMLTSRAAKNVELGAAPNGGPATRLDNPGVAGGPPIEAAIAPRQTSRTVSLS